LTSTSNLLGIGSNITLIDYNKIINIPLSFPTDLSSYYNKTENDTLISNYSNFTSNTSNILKAFIDIKENPLTFSSPLARTTGTISLNTTLISYNDLANKPTLSFLPLTGGTLTGNIIINATNSSFTFGGGAAGAVGQASNTTAFSSSAAIGDFIVRSQATKQPIYYQVQVLVL
jgi:hypothetical protein